MCFSENCRMVRGRSNSDLNSPQSFRMEDLYTDCVDPDGIPRYRSLSAHLSGRVRIRVVPRREQSSSLGSVDPVETKAFLF